MQFVSSSAITSPFECKDKNPLCDSMNSDLCTNPMYTGFVRNNCLKFCNWCPGSELILKQYCTIFHRDILIMHDTTNVWLYQNFYDFGKDYFLWKYKVCGAWLCWEKERDTQRERERGALKIKSMQRNSEHLLTYSLKGHYMSCFLFRWCYYNKDSQNRWVINIVLCH